MKTLFSRVLAALTLCAGLEQAAAQGTAFTYQGQLSNGTNPVTGLYNFKFDTFNASTGGSTIGGPITNTAVPVTNGLFTTVIDFGANVFTGATNWMLIQVTTNGGTNFVSLLPRQQLMPTPYAIYAEGANAAGLSGTVPAASISGTYGGALTLSNANNAIAGNGSGLTGLNASQLASGTVPNASLAPDVAFTDSNQTFTAQNTFSTGTNAGRLTVSGSTPVDTSLFSGLGFQFNGGNGNASIIASFNDGFASLNFYTKQGAGYPFVKQVAVSRYGDLEIDQQSYNSGVLNNGTTNGVGLTFGSGSGEGIASQRTAGVNKNGLDFYTSYNHRMSILNNGNVGIGTTNPGSLLEVNGNVRLDDNELYLGTNGGTFGNDGLVFGDGGLPGINGGNGPFLSGNDGGALGALSPSIVCLSWDGHGNVAVSNNLSAWGTIFGNGSGLTNLNASQVGGLAASNFWQTTGNAGTSPGVNFLGTSDNEPLIFRANDQVGLQLQYSSVSTGPPLVTSQSSINVIGGYWNNTISSGVVGGTIAGGGGASRLGFNNYSSPNTVTGSYGTVGGGVANSAGNYGTVPGGNDNVASGLDSFAAGQSAQALNQGAFVWADSETPVFASTANDQFLIRAQGGVGIGTASPEQALSVNGGLNLDQAGLNAGFVNNGNTNGSGLTFGINSGEGIASDRVSGVNQYGLDFYTSFAHRMSILQNGKVGIGITNPLSLLEVNGDVRIDGNNLYLEPGGGGSFQYDGLTWGTPGLPGISGGYGPFLAGYDGGAVGALNPNTICLSWDSIGDVWVSNDCSVASLTIRGGADLAEPFNISSTNSEVPEGAVVVIDEQNPGHLKLSDNAYDPRVAGIVSGANGIHPGIQMHQQGIIEGGKNVALSGRVYVQADTSNGAIKPGDLLTTSDVPGYAMKVTNHARAAGAILGKAMTGLNEGKGMVLVLVTLQ